VDNFFLERKEQTTDPLTGVKKITQSQKRVCIEKLNGMGNLFF
jgi:hypothetical protein